MYFWELSFIAQICFKVSVVFFALLPSWIAEWNHIVVPPPFIPNCQKHRVRSPYYYGVAVGSGKSAKRASGLHPHWTPVSNIDRWCECKTWRSGIGIARLHNLPRFHCFGIPCLPYSCFGIVTQCWTSRSPLFALAHFLSQRHHRSAAMQCLSSSRQLSTLRQFIWRTETSIARLHNVSRFHCFGIPCLH